VRSFRAAPFSASSTCAIAAQRRGAVIAAAGEPRGRCNPCGQTSGCHRLIEVDIEQGPVLLNENIPLAAQAMPRLGANAPA
jgi:hypothetical protein